MFMSHKHQILLFFGCPVWAIIEAEVPLAWTGIIRHDQNMVSF